MDAKTFNKKYNHQYLEEGYVGKSDNLLEIEKVFEEIKKSIEDQRWFQWSIGRRDAMVSRMERLLEAEFGFASANIRLIEQAIPNAMTMPWLSRCNRKVLTSMPKQLTRHGNRYKDNKTYVATFYLYTGLIEELTAEEMTAILCHEVGHNFDLMQANYCADLFAWLFFIYNNILEPIADIVQFLNKVWTDIMLQIQEFFSKINIRLVKILEKGMFECAKLFQFGISPTYVNILSSAITNPQQTMLRVAFSTFGYAKEEWSDSFASAYGYGPALMSALSKMEDIMTMPKMKIFKRGAVLNQVYYVNSTLTSLPVMLFDEHQENQTRIRKLLDDLEKTAADPNMPPQQKTLILRDVKVARAIYDKYVNGIDDEGRKGIAQATIRTFKDLAFDGKLDFRTYLYKVNALSVPKEGQYESTDTSTILSLKNKLSTIG